MYLKLTLRNAKRSVNDYLLYIATVTLFISIMTISNYIAIAGNVEAGFQTESLPILITIILIVLLGYINRFMLKQRSKELANYILLGMEKSKLSCLFIFELWIIGILCYIGGSLVGIGASAIYSYYFLLDLDGFDLQQEFFVQSLGKTLFYFCIVEVLYGVYMKWIMSRLQIFNLMTQEKRNQKLGGVRKNRFWGILFGISFLATIGLFLQIVCLPEDALSITISFLSIPSTLAIFAFYKWLYEYLARIRQQSEELYYKNRLYIIAQITSEIKTNAIMNSIFCMCLLLSISSFVTGIFMLQSEIKIFATKSQQWMGILQVSLCMIFIILYFSILSLLQIVEYKRESRNMKILHYIGKDEKQIKYIMKLQIFIKLFIPSIMVVFLLLIGTPCLNYKFNRVFSSSMNHILLKTLGVYFICFFALYLLYFFIAYHMGKSYVKKLTNSSL